MVVLVDNNAGVLARISSLFVQRGFNIESLTVSPTENEKLSRLTIMTSGDEKTFQQIIKQTGKLVGLGRAVAFVGYDLLKLGQGYRQLGCNSLLPFS